ncbi:MAG TPA: MFS transporter [Oscillospiraceae bacterium]|nr:MFS transporter [Oscillospiraceae bacterium]HPS75428.1 MFS transporter [Oscillospiraceae bacterium]
MKKVHYAWVICGACTLLQFTVSGLLTNSFTVFQPCILAQNGFSNTQLSALIEIRTVCAFLALFFVMGYYKKLGLKMGVALSVALTGAAFGLFALAGSFPAYCAAFALGGVAYTLGGAVPVALLLSAWFNDRGGLALGIAAAGTGINNIVASPLFTRLILGSSLRAGFLVQVLFCAAVALLLFFLLKTPRERGEEPYTDARSAGRAPVPGAFRMTRGQLILMLISALLLGGYVNTGFGYLTTMYTLEGFGSMQVAYGMSLTGAALIGGKCLYGLLSDRRGAPAANAVFYGASAAGLLLCCLGGTSPVRMFSSLLFSGVGFSMTSVALPIWAADLSGGDYPGVLKKFQMANMAGNLLFNMLPGPVADHFGSYVPVYIVFTAICAVSAVLVQRVYAARKKSLTAPVST